MPAHQDAAKPKSDGGTAPAPRCFLSSSVVAVLWPFQLSTTGLFFQEAPMTRILVDVITNITFHNGVVRVECGTVGPDGKANPSGSLLIPPR
jgi:hypothetical protein